MLRLRDILSELEGRVEPLRKEAEKAREYLALADERRTLEIGVWLAKIDQLSAQYRELQDKFLAARGEYDSLAREEEGMEAVSYTHLSRGVLVVRADEYSGSLITAGHALSQGRDVFAVPGRIDETLSRGTNKLLLQGAKPVTCAGDILEEYASVPSWGRSVPSQVTPDPVSYTHLDVYKRQGLDHRSAVLRAQARAV